MVSPPRAFLRRWFLDQRSQQRRFQPARDSSSWSIDRERLKGWKRRVRKIQSTGAKVRPPRLPGTAERVLRRPKDNRQRSFSRDWLLIGAGAASLAARAG